jgi:hypothetical protein
MNVGAFIFFSLQVQEKLVSEELYTSEPPTASEGGKLSALNNTVSV